MRVRGGNLHVRTQRRPASRLVQSARASFSRQPRRRVARPIRVDADAVLSSGIAIENYETFLESSGADKIIDKHSASFVAPGGGLVYLPAGTLVHASYIMIDKDIPKLAEEHDLEYWNKEAVASGNIAPQLKIEPEKDKPITINYDELVKSWQK